MHDPDLRILALADAKVLPPQIQDPFDHWRIWKARDAVTTAVRRRMTNMELANNVILKVYLERLEQADNEETIFEGIYALAEVVEVYRQHLGMHSEYLVLIMAAHLNPWGLLSLQTNFEHPGASVLGAVHELWRLVGEHPIDVETTLKQIGYDETLVALDAYYANHPNKTKIK
ncbi:MAG: hypothetical protein ABI947_01945 [Chloroflexota bacterium]